MTQPPLANAELAVMELLWRHGPLTAREIRERLYPDGAPGTVQRLLQRLEAKDFVARDRSATVNLFTARIGREAYAGSQLESLTDKLTGGSVAPLITHLLEQNKISRAELERLRAILEESDDAGDRS